MTPAERPVILVIDDEERIRAGLADFLIDLGFETLCAGSAEQGMEVLASQKVDLCTVDLRLPGASGVEFILRARAARPGLQFLIYTGTPDFELADNLRALGMTDDDVIAKPAPDLGLILAAVNRLLGRRPG